MRSLLSKYLRYSYHLHVSTIILAAHLYSLMRSMHDSEQQVWVFLKHT